MSETMTYREAARLAMTEAMKVDPRVFLMGEDVGRYGGCYAVSKGMLDAFGEDRIRDTPLSESAFVGAGIGAALGGMRPIVEVMTVNFSLLALDQIVNNAALLRHMSGGQFSVPLVIRMATGAGKQLAAQHSHSLEGWFAHVPGLKILAAGTVDDARWMLDAALKDKDPVLLFEHVMLYNEEGPVEAAAPAEPWKARVRRAGDRVSIIAYGGMLPKAMGAATELAKSGIESEVIDLRSLVPLDLETITESVSKTGRCVIVHEATRTCGFGAELMSLVQEECFYSLEAPIIRVTGWDTPYPHAQEWEYFPGPDRVGAALKKVMED